MYWGRGPNLCSDLLECTGGRGWQPLSCILVGGDGNVCVSAFLKLSLQVRRSTLAQFGEGNSILNCKSFLGGEQIHHWLVLTLVRTIIPSLPL